MKIIVSLILAFMGLSAFAMPVEVECSARSVNVAVEQGFSPGSFRRALAVTSTERLDFTVSARGSFANRVRYEALGFDLEVDFWPDARPHWGRTYRGIFRSSEMGIPFTQMWCRFPNIAP
jgi:hypothetical protein